MFGLLIPHRPVQASPHQIISPTQYVFNVAANPPFTHLAVFLLPDQTLPPDTVAAIYIKLPDSPNQPANGFKLRGAVGIEKQSALFRLQETRRPPSDELVCEVAMKDDASSGELPGSVSVSPDASITVGVSIEPTAQIQAQINALFSTPSTHHSLGEQDRTPATAVLRAVAQRIGQHAYNYLSSFATGPSGSENVPIKKLQDWWTTFEKKLEMDTSFLTRDHG